VVTLDRDFTTLLAIEGRDAPSVIYIRITGLDRSRTVRQMRFILTRVPPVDGPCYVATITPTGIRVRTLPI